MFFIYQLGVAMDLQKKSFIESDESYSHSLKIFIMEGVRWPSPEI